MRNKYRQNVPNWKRELIYHQFNGRCMYCGVILENNWHLDHINPICSGGKNNLENLGAACPRCNMLKGGLNLEQFRDILKLDVIRKKNQALNKYFDERLLIYLDDETVDEIYTQIVDFDHYIAYSIKVLFYFERK